MKTQDTINDDPSSMVISTVSNDGLGKSYFSERIIELNGDEHRRLSEQIAAVNFRLRKSDVSYASDWHVAGDPTLLLMLKGTMEIELRSGQTKAFGPGEMFIAEDFLDKGVAFDAKLHGHRAQVINQQGIHVLHLKLKKRT